MVNEVYAATTQGVQGITALGLLGGANQTGNVQLTGLDLSPRRTPAFSAMRQPA
jgi:hypothetical protein